MRLGPLGLPEILLILLVVLLIFGPRRLPEMAKGLGQSVREFRRGIKDMKEDFENEAKDAPKGGSVNASTATTATAGAATTAPSAAAPATASASAADGASAAPSAASPTAEAEPSTEPAVTDGPAAGKDESVKA